MIWLLTSIVAVETIALVVVSIFAYRTAMSVLRVQDAIEQSLDVLDKRYESISKILKIPLFYDSPEIKRAVDDIRMSREAILYVANQLTSVQEEEEEIGHAMEEEAEVYKDSGLLSQEIMDEIEAEEAEEERKGIEWRRLLRENKEKRWRKELEEISKTWEKEEAGLYDMWNTGVVWKNPNESNQNQQ